MIRRTVAAFIALVLVAGCAGGSAVPTPNPYAGPRVKPTPESCCAMPKPTPDSHRHRIH